VQTRIAHHPTDRNKARWKAVTLLALIGFWLFSGITGRDPWKPDELTYVGILQHVAQGRDLVWWPRVGGSVVPGELALIHWATLPVAWLTSAWLELHEAARLATILWTASAIAALATATRHWSGGHISWLTAVLVIGCLGLYDRAHSYLPDVALFAAIAWAIAGSALLPDRSRIGVALITGAIVVAAAARGLHGFLLVVVPLAVLMAAPVLSAHRASLVRSLLLGASVCGVLAWGLWQADPAAFQQFLADGAGIQRGGRERLAPFFYGTTLLWFAWPVWPVAVWLVVLRGRGFYGGWQRAEVIVPAVFFLCGFVLLCVTSDAKAAFLLSLLPPLVVLAAFGVDTIKRTWYGLIDWFGILVLGLTALVTVLVSSALYLKWPPNLAQWMTRYVPNFQDAPPWMGYAVALIAFVIWLALIQPAQQHARRAFINWAGCVTFLWVVVQALLIRPADYISSYRATFERLLGEVPVNACVSALAVPSGQTAMLAYHGARPIRSAATAATVDCPFVVVLRDRGGPEPTIDRRWQMLASAARPGDNSERYTLYRNPAAPIVTQSPGRS
jgi:4-amino-4-deoxy-L-arabinose transferase-like glycosyltransferase